MSEASWLSFFEDSIIVLGPAHVPGPFFGSVENNPMVTGEFLRKPVLS